MHGNTPHILSDISHTFLSMRSDSSFPRPFFSCYILQSHQFRETVSQIAKDYEPTVISSMQNMEIGARSRLDSSVRCNYFETFKYTVRNRQERGVQTVILMRGIDSHVILYRRYTLHSKARDNCTLGSSCRIAHCGIEAIITYKIPESTVRRSRSYSRYEKIITCLTLAKEFTTRKETL